MPNGGTNVHPDDLGTYRKSEIAQLETSHANLLEACKAIDDSAAPYRAADTSPERAYIVSRDAMQQIRAAVAETEKPSTG